MLTSSPRVMVGADDSVRDDRPAYRPYRVRVAARRQLNARFVRVTFTGPDLATFGTDGLDQRIKLLFPAQGAKFADLGVDDAESVAAGDWYARWRALPEDARTPFRTYTVRAVRPEHRQVDVDFVVHDHDGDPGPAARWLRTAGVGDDLVVVGPDARSRHSAAGIDWHPGTATHVLLAGDETAVPAIGAVLERLGPDRHATVLIEVQDAADAVALPTAAVADVRWVVRDPDAPGAALLASVRDWTQRHPELLRAAAAPQPQQLDEVDIDAGLLWESPDDVDGSLYAWLAGEAATIKELRRLLVTRCGVDRSHVAFMGYWRRGRAELT